jgi:hypothetical protein
MVTYDLMLPGTYPGEPVRHTSVRRRLATNPASKAPNFPSFDKGCLKEEIRQRRASGMRIERWWCQYRKAITLSGDCRPKMRWPSSVPVVGHSLWCFC